MTHNDRALCRCGIRIPSARNRCPAFDKDKYLELMFGDVGQARTNAAMLLMPIATTLSRTCTKPTVGSSFVCRICQSFENIFDVPFLFERPNLKYFWSNLKGNKS